MLMLVALFLTGCALEPYIPPTEGADMPAGYYGNPGEPVFYGKPPG